MTFIHTKKRIEYSHQLGKKLIVCIPSVCIIYHWLWMVRLHRFMKYLHIQAVWIKYTITHIEMSDSALDFIIIVVF